MKAIKLDGETADRICLENISQHMKLIKQDIATLKKVKSPQSYQKEDLGNDIYLLDAMQTVYKYYGGKE